jgi:hypothetical protein
MTQAWRRGIWGFGVPMDRVSSRARRRGDCTGPSSLLSRTVPTRIARDDEHAMPGYYMEGITRVLVRERNAKNKPRRTDRIWRWEDVTINTIACFACELSTLLYAQLRASQGTWLAHQKLSPAGTTLFLARVVRFHFLACTAEGGITVQRRIKSRRSTDHASVSQVQADLNQKKGHNSQS